MTVAAHTVVEGVHGLECDVGSARLLIPADAVGHIVTYPVSSNLPLAARWIGGLGAHEGRILVSVSLGERPPFTNRTRWVKGVVLVTPGSSVRWALEVEDVHSFVEAVVRPRGEASKSRYPDWVRLGDTRDRRVVVVLDVLRMVRALSEAQNAS